LNKALREPRHYYGFRKTEIYIKIGVWMLKKIAYILVLILSGVAISLYRKLGFRLITTYQKSGIQLVSYAIRL
jgi:hypothetical protein